MPHEITISCEDGTRLTPAFRLRRLAVYILQYLSPPKHPNLDEVLGPLHRINSASLLVETITPRRVFVLNRTATVPSGQNRFAINKIIVDFAAEREGFALEPCGEECLIGGRVGDRAAGSSV